MSADDRVGKGPPPSPDRRENYQNDPYQLIREKVQAVSRLGDPFLLAFSDVVALFEVIPTTTFSMKNTTSAMELFLTVPEDLDTADIEHSVEDYQLGLIRDRIADRRQGDLDYKRESVWLHGLMPKLFDHEAASNLMSSGPQEIRPIDRVLDIMFSCELKLNDMFNQTATRLEAGIDYLEFREQIGLYTKEELYNAVENELIGVKERESPRMIAFYTLANAIAADVAYSGSKFVSSSQSLGIRNILNEHIARSDEQNRINADTIPGFKRSWGRLTELYGALFEKEKEDIELEPQRGEESVDSDGIALRGYNAIQDRIYEIQTKLNLPGQRE